LRNNVSNEHFHYVTATNVDVSRIFQVRESHLSSHGDLVDRITTYL